MIASRSSTVLLCLIVLGCSAPQFPSGAPSQFDAYEALTATDGGELASRWEGCYQLTYSEQPPKWISPPTLISLSRPDDAAHRGRPYLLLRNLSIVDDLPPRNHGLPGVQLPEQIDLTRMDGSTFSVRFGYSSLFCARAVGEELEVVLSVREGRPMSPPVRGRGKKIPCPVTQQ